MSIDDIIERFAGSNLSDSTPALFDGSAADETGQPCEFKADYGLLQKMEAARPRDALLYDTAHLVGARVRLSNLWRRDNAALAGKVATIVGDPFPFIVPQYVGDLDDVYVKMLCPVALEATGDLPGLAARLADQHTSNLPGAGFSGGWPGDGVACVDAKNLEFVCQACGRPGKLQACKRCEFAKYCSRECQRRHWPAHKPACAASAKRRAERSGPAAARLRFPIGAWVESKIDLDGLRASAAGRDPSHPPFCKCCRDEAFTMGAENGEWAPALVVGHVGDAYVLCFADVPVPGYPARMIPGGEGERWVEARVPEDAGRVRELPEVDLAEFYDARVRDLGYGSAAGCEWDTSRLEPGEAASGTVVCLASLLCGAAHDKDLVEFSCIARGMLGTDVGRAVARFVRGGGHTVLQMAAKYLRPTHVNVLLDLGAAAIIDAQTDEGNTALSLAARRPNLTIVKRLLAEGADPHLEADFGGYGLTALACAVQGGFREVAELLADQPCTAEERAVEELALLFVLLGIELQREKGPEPSRWTGSDQKSRDMRHLNKVHIGAAAELLFGLKARDGWFEAAQYQSVFNVEALTFDLDAAAGIVRPAMAQRRAERRAGGVQG